MIDLANNLPRLHAVYKNRLFGKGYCIIPIHMVKPYEHWFIILLHMMENDDERRMTVFIFDSIGKRSRTASNIVEEKIIPYLKTCAGNESESITFISKKIEVPAQCNGYDCGVYAMKITSCILTYIDADKKNLESDTNIKELENHIKKAVTEESTKKLRDELYEVCGTYISKSKKELYYRGIENKGHTCWINSTLQFLFTNQKRMYQIYMHTRTGKDIDPVWRKVMEIFAKSVICKQETNEMSLKFGQWKSIDLYDMMSLLGFMKEKHKGKVISFLRDDNDIEDEDCGELLTVLADEDVRKYCDSFIFETYVEEFTCKVCRDTRSQTLAKSNVYTLQFDRKDDEKRSVQEMMNDNLKEINIEFRCRYCYHKGINGGEAPTVEEITEGEKEGGEKYVKDELVPFTEHYRSPVKFRIMPQTLMIQLMRAVVKVQETEGKWEVERYKVTTPVDYFENNMNIIINETTYSIRALIYHTGEFDDKGHYTCDSLRPTKVTISEMDRELRWHTCNDKTITVQPENYMQKIIESPTKKNDKMKEVALLMYEKQ
jgi:ubiquitin C-terminal hydrolase